MVVYASFGRRLWAFVLDGAIDLILLGTLSVAAGGNWLGGTFLCWYLIHHVGLVTEGGTLGHRLAGLRIVRSDGSRLGVAHAAIRQVVLVCASLPPLGLGVLWMLDDPERRTWHDRAAGSVVVRELAAIAALAPTWADDPPWRPSDQVPVPDHLGRVRPNTA